MFLCSLQQRSKLRTGIEAERWGQKYVWNRCFGPRDQGPDGTGPYRSELRLAVDRCGFEDVETAGMVPFSLLNDFLYYSRPAVAEGWAQAGN